MATEQTCTKSESICFQMGSLSSDTLGELIADIFDKEDVNNTGNVHSESLVVAMTTLFQNDLVMAQSLKRALDPNNMNPLLSRLEFVAKCLSWVETFQDGSGSRQEDRQAMDESFSAENWHEEPTELFENEELNRMKKDVQRLRKTNRNLRENYKSTETDLNNLEAKKEQHVMNKSFPCMNGKEEPTEPYDDEALSRLQQEMRRLTRENHNLRDDYESIEDDLANLRTQTVEMEQKLKKRQSEPALDIIKEADLRCASDCPSEFLEVANTSFLTRVEQDFLKEVEKRTELEREVEHLKLRMEQAQHKEEELQNIQKDLHEKIALYLNKIASLNEQVESLNLDLQDTKARLLLKEGSYDELKEDFLNLKSELIDKNATSSASRTRVFGSPDTKALTSDLSMDEHWLKNVDEENVSAFISNATNMASNLAMSERVSGMSIADEFRTVDEGLSTAPLDDNNNTNDEPSECPEDEPIEKGKTREVSIQTNTADATEKDAFELFKRWMIRLILITGAAIIIFTLCGAINTSEKIYYPATYSPALLTWLEPYSFVKIDRCVSVF